MMARTLKRALRPHGSSTTRWFIYVKNDEMRPRGLGHLCLPLLIPHALCPSLQVVCACRGTTLIWTMATTTRAGGLRFLLMHKLLWTIPKSCGNSSAEVCICINCSFGIIFALQRIPGRGNDQRGAGVNDNNAITRQGDGRCMIRSLIDGPIPP